VVSREHVERIHKHKTGALISASAVSGGLIAGTSSEQLDNIREFGDRLGLLFQITDDLLDRAQPSEILGKTAGKDVSAEKATYPSVIGVEASEALCDRVHDEIVRGLENFPVDTSLLAALVDYVRSRRS
jgi:geranylgeranyl diphosphate synthase type II